MGESGLVVADPWWRKDLGGLGDIVVIIMGVGRSMSSLSPRGQEERREGKFQEAIAVGWTWIKIQTNRQVEAKRKTNWILIRLSG